MHTIQLAINNGLKGDSISYQKSYPEAIPSLTIIKNDLLATKTLIKQMRLFKYRRQMEELGIKIPILPNETRWNSVYLMIESLVNTKDFIRFHSLEYTELIYDDSLFSRLMELIKVLSIFNEINKPMQNDFLAYSEFYLMWDFAKGSLKNTNNMFSNIFLMSMHFREEILLVSQLSMWALFIDPRTKGEMCVEPAIDIREELYSFYLTVDAMRKEKENVVPKDISKDSGAPLFNSLSESTPISCLDRYKENKIKRQKEVSDGKSDSIKRRLFEDIDRYCIQEFEDPKDDLIAFWVRKGLKYPYLFIVAMTILQVPATEVSVERNFSRMKLFLSDLRVNLGEKVLNQMMIISLNKK